MASQEVQELLIKAAITLSPTSFMSRFFWLRRKGRSPPCHPSQKLEPICKGGAYQDGRSTFLSRPNSTKGVDGEAGSERCIRSDLNPPRPSPLIQFTWEEKHYIKSSILWTLDYMQLTMVPMICRLCECLGLMVNMQKSLLTPTQILEFLGFQVIMPSLTSKKSGKDHRESCGNILQSLDLQLTTSQDYPQGSLEKYESWIPTGDQMRNDLM